MGWFRERINCVGLIICEGGGVQKRASEEGVSGIRVPSSNMAVVMRSGLKVGLDK